MKKVHFALVVLLVTLTALVSVSCSNEASNPDSKGDGGKTTAKETDDFSSFMKTYDASQFILDRFAGDVMHEEEIPEDDMSSGSETNLYSGMWSSEKELLAVTDLFTNRAKTERLLIKSSPEASGCVMAGKNMLEVKDVTIRIVYQKQTSTDSGANWTDEGSEMTGYLVMSAKRTRSAVSDATEGTYTYSVSGITLSVIPDANGEYMNIEGKSAVSYPDITYTLTGSDFSTLSGVSISGSSLSSDALVKAKTSLTCTHQFTKEETPATCENKGSIVLTCSVCNYVESTEIPSLGHSYVFDADKISPNTISCSSGEGHLYYKCSRSGCESTSVKDFTSDPNAHIAEMGAYYYGFIFSQYTQATKSSSGSMTLTHAANRNGCGATDSVISETSLDSKLVGTWKNDSKGVTLVINDDGTCKFTCRLYSSAQYTTNWCVVAGADDSVAKYSILCLIYDPAKVNHEGISVPYVFSDDMNSIATMFGVLYKQ